MIKECKACKDCSGYPGCHNHCIEVLKPKWALEEKNKQKPLPCRWHRNWRDFKVTMVQKGGKRNDRE